METERRSIYIETTIPSYASARPSTDLIIAAHQAITRIFWDQEREKYDLFLSQAVIDECMLGGREAAQKRLDMLTGIPALPQTAEITALAEIYQKLLSIPDRAKTDCLHLASAVLAQTDFLLSWNCRHLGLTAYVKVRDYNEQRKLWSPLLVTPEYFVEVQAEVIE